MLELLMVCVSVMLVTLILTQLLIPAFRGRVLFPLFRGRILKVESDLARKETGKRVHELEISALRLEQENQRSIHKVLDELIEDDNKKEGKDKWKV